MLCHQPRSFAAWIPGGTHSLSKTRPKCVIQERFVRRFCRQICQLPSHTTPVFGRLGRGSNCCIVAGTQFWEMGGCSTQTDCTTGTAAAEYPKGYAGDKFDTAATMMCLKSGSSPLRFGSSCLTTRHARACGNVESILLSLHGLDKYHCKKTVWTIQNGSNSL